MDYKKSLESKENRKADRICINCLRDNEAVTLTIHHIIPKTKGGKKGEKTILCLDCHQFLNTQFTENEQRDWLDTKTKIKKNKKMANFAKFAKKQKKRVKQKDSKRRKKKRNKN